MKKIFSLVLVLIFTSSFAQKISQDYSFYENKGQIVDQNGKANPDVKYLLNSPGFNVQIRSNGFSYDVYETEKRKLNKQKLTGNQKEIRKRELSDNLTKSKYHRVDIDFVDSKNNPEIVAEYQSKDYDNYYNIPSKKEGVSFVHKYKKLTYKNLYKNIDLIFFKPEDSTKTVEYNFLVHPGGRISDIKMRFKGAKTKLKDNKLSMNLRFGEMQENIPNSWIESDKNQNIAVGYKDLGNQTFGFSSAINNSDKTIVIDPVPIRIWGTLYGGNNYESFSCLEIDGNNDLYLGGSTNSTDTVLATSGAYQSSFYGGYDGFIVKFDKDGKRLWGSYYDKYTSYGTVLNLDFNTDHLFLFEVSGSSQCIAKFNKNGTFIWEKEIDISKFYINDLKIKNNHLYLGGSKTENGLSKPYVEKYDDNGNFLKSVSFPNSEAGKYAYITKFSDDKDTNSKIFAIGETNSSGFSAINGLQNTFGGNTDVMIAGFDENLSIEQFSYYGLSNREIPVECKLENDIFKVFYKGVSSGSNNHYGGVLKYNINTNNIISDNTFAIPYNQDTTGYFDNSGNLFIGGTSYPNQTDVATPGAYLENSGFSNKSIIIKYDSTEKKEWGSFYGGNGSANHALIRRDGEQFIYLAGMALNNTSGMATPGAFQSNNYNNNGDGYIVKFAENCLLSITLSSNSPICIGQELNLSASGGTSYVWTGPNGFSSNLQNPKIPNVSAANAGTYTCTVTGTAGCDTSTMINIVIGDSIKPVPNAASLPKITGDCKTIITTIPTATDNCRGNIIATTTSPLSYQLPGSYTITWNYDDGNGNITTQTQQVEITPQPLPTANPTQTFCKINNPKISDILVTATSPKWYDATGNIINTSTLLIDNTKYYVSQNISGCESGKIEILIKLSDPNPPTGDATQDFCSASNPTVKNIVVTGAGIKWFDNLGTQIPDTTPLQSGQTYYASQTISGCESTQKLSVKVNVVTNTLSAKDFTDTFCNDTTDNFKAINLDDYKKEFITNPQDYSFEFRNSSNQIVSGNVNLNIGSNIFDVKITSSLGCYQFVKLSLTLNPKPKVNLPNEAEFCDNLGVILDAGAGFSNYDWSTGEKTQTIKADKEQTYKVTVTNLFGCKNTASVIVKKAKLAEIQNILINNSNATVIMSVAGNYLYSLDQIKWQSSNKFDNLENGNYTVFVKTNLGCDLGSKTFTIFSLSNIFSPNGDNINDTWKISGIENYPNSEIKIIDKNGKMVVNVITKGETFEWNGESNGRKLPSDSYWYQIKLSDGRILEGYVVIKNRN